MAPLSSYFFAQPWAFFLLTLPVGFWAWYSIIYSRRRLRLRLSYDPNKLAGQPRVIGWLRWLAPVLATAVLVFWVIALARPQRNLNSDEVFAEGIDILLLMDCSTSMQIADFVPNRLEVAKQTALQFIDGRKDDRIGIVLFAKDAFSYAPLTLDYGLLRRLITDIKPTLLPDANRTSVGNAIGVGINRLRSTPHPSQVMILITDGASNEGILDPVSAAKLAAESRIRIYTIAVGKESYLYEQPGAAPQLIQTDFDQTTLEQVADITGGTFYRSTDEQSLTRIFQQISNLERTKVKQTVTREVEDAYPPFLVAGLLCALAFLALQYLGLANLLES